MYNPFFPGREEREGCLLLLWILYFFFFCKCSDTGMMCGKMESKDRYKGDKSKPSGVVTLGLHGNCSQPSLPNGANQVWYKQIWVNLRTTSGFNLWVQMSQHRFSINLCSCFWQQWRLLKMDLFKQTGMAAFPWFFFPELSSAWLLGRKQQLPPCHLLFLCSETTVMEWIQPGVILLWISSLTYLQ